MTDRRHHFRTPVNCHGMMTLDGMTTACNILDLTEQGCLLQTIIPLRAGDTVLIKCHLSEEHPIRCTLRIVHAEGLRAGGLISGIATDTHRHVRHFLDLQNPPKHTTQ